MLAMKRRFAGWARRAGGGATRATRALTAAMALSWSSGDPVSCDDVRACTCVLDVGRLAGPPSDK